MRPMSEILSDALASFEGGKRWIRGALFQDAKGMSTSSAGYLNVGVKTAEKFCAYGAIYKSMYAHGELTDIDSVDQRAGVIRVVESVLKPANAATVVGANDHAPSFEVVHQMFCTGIKKALSEEEKAPKEYRCPKCGGLMGHPPRDYNICPNRDCFVEFGYDWPECNDDGTLLPGEWVRSDPPEKEKEG